MKAAAEPSRTSGMLDGMAGAYAAVPAEIFMPNKWRKE